MVRAAMPSTSPTGRRYPLSAWRTTSGSPPASEPTTGTPRAIASRADRPNDSSSEGRRKTSASPTISSIACCVPRKRRRSTRPSRRARAWAEDRSGPSPTISSTASTSRTTRSKMRTTSSTRLTGRKFETWSSTFWPGAAKPVRSGRSSGYCSRSTKFGMTSMGFVIWNSAAVIRWRKPETAVTASDRSIPKRVISKKERSCPTIVMSVPWSVVTMRGAPVAEHLLGEEAGDRVGDRVVDVEELEAVLARGLRHLHREGEVVGRVLEERVARDVHLVEADVLLEVAEAERQPVGDDVDVVAPAGELLAELGRHRPRAADGRVADDPDLHSRTTWWPRAKGSRRRLEVGEERQAVPADGAHEAEPALLERAPGEEGVAGSPEAVRAPLVALLEGAQGLLVEALDLVERAPAGRGGGRAQRRVVGAEGLLDAAHLALDRLARAGEGGLDVRVGLAGPARDERLGVAHEVAEGQPLGVERPRLLRLDEGEARPGKEGGARDPEVRVRGGDLGVVRDLGGAAHVGGGRQQRVLDERAEEGAGAPRHGVRLEAPQRLLDRPALAGAAHLDGAVREGERAALALDDREEVQEAGPHRHLLVVAGGEERPARLEREARRGRALAELAREDRGP